MKFKLNFKNKEASIEADAERIIEKNMDYKQENINKFGPKKTRYQIKQEELRKNKEQEHKHEMQGVLLGFGILAVIIAFCMIMHFVTGE